MRTTGKVIAGRVELDEPFPDGTFVEVESVNEDQETFLADPELEAHLVESIDQGRRGETVPGDEVMKKLRTR